MSHCILPMVVSLALVGCGDERRVPADPGTAGSGDIRVAGDVRVAGANGGAATDAQFADAEVIDAAAIDAQLATVYSCSARMSVKGKLRVELGESSRTGAITMFTAGKAPSRHIFVTVEPDGNKLTLLFDRYAPHDHSTIRGERKPRPARERLVKGKSIVARLETVAPGMARLYVDGEVDWTTDTGLVVKDGQAECAEVPAESP